MSPDLKSLIRSTKNRSALSYHGPPAVLKGICPQQLYVMGGSLRPQALERPLGWPCPPVSAFLKLSGLLYPLVLAFAALSLCGYLISPAKIIGFHLCPGSLEPGSAQQMFIEKFLSSLPNLLPFLLGNLSEIKEGQHPRGDAYQFYKDLHEGWKGSRIADTVAEGIGW